MSEFGEMRENQIVQQTVSSLSHQNEAQTILFVTKVVFTYTISQYLLPQFLSRPIYVLCHDVNALVLIQSQHAPSGISKSKTIKIHIACNSREHGFNWLRGKGSWGGGEGELSKQVEARLVNYQCISLQDQLLAGCQRSVIRAEVGGG